MAARSIDTGIITFGLVSIPIRIYPATRAGGGISFHLVHEKDGERLKQQYVCPKDGEVVPRSEMAKGFEVSRGRYVLFSNEELKALEEKASEGIEIAEFVPTSAVDPVYFERTYYLGPDAGGEKAYALLAKGMEETGRAALARYVARGKDYLVLIRAFDGRLVMQQLYHSDEVRDVSEVPIPKASASPNEVRLATQLIEHIAAEEFHPERFEDQVRKRVKQWIDKKARGEDITEAKPARKKEGEVIDLMEALKASLAAPKAKGRARKPPRQAPARTTRRAPARKAARRSRRTA